MAVAVDDSGVIAKLDIYADEIGRLRNEMTRIDRDLVALRLEMAGIKVRLMIAAFGLGLIPSLIALALRVIH